MKHRSTGKRSRMVAVAALIGIGLTQHARAAELGFYVAGYYGEATRAAVNKAPFDAFANRVYALYDFTPETSTSFLGDDADSSFGMMAGYRLFPNLAIEGGYMDLGRIKYRNNSFGTHIDHQEPWLQTLGAGTSGVALSALGILPLTYRWEAYVRGGVLFATNEVDLYVTDFFGDDARRRSDSSAELLAGVGAAFSFAEVYGLRVEFQRVFGAGGEVAESDFDVLSLGFTVNF